MGRPVLNVDLEGLETLRTATRLGESVVVDQVDSELGPRTLVGAGPVVFTRESFVLFWMWSMCNAQVYKQNVVSNEIMTHSLLELNPEFFQSWIRDQLVPPVGVVYEILFKKMNYIFRNMDLETKYQILQRVVEEIPG